MLRKAGLTALILGFWGSAPGAEVTVIRARALIDGVSAQARPNPEIVVRDNRIAEVYAAGSRPAPPAAKIIDLGGATVLPGLIDCHTHVFLQGEVPSAG